MVDWLPVVSQVKSLVQVTFGDKEGAKYTQERFIRQCPMISQVTSAVQAVKGDKEAARTTQLEFLNQMGSIVDGVPIVGHLKGSIHYALKDKNQGDAAMKKSSHTSGAVAGGVGGFLIGGPLGSALGGMLAGTAMDGIITLSEYGVSKKWKPEGICKPILDPKNPGKWVDGVAGVAVGGLIGHGAGAVASAASLKPMVLHIVMSKEHKQSLISVTRLAAQTAVQNIGITIVSKVGEQFGKKVDIEMIDKPKVEDETFLSEILEEHKDEKEKIDIGMVDKHSSEKGTDEDTAVNEIEVRPKDREVDEIVEKTRINNENIVNKMVDNIKEEEERVNVMIGNLEDEKELVIIFNRGVDNPKEEDLIIEGTERYG